MNRIAIPACLALVVTACTGDETLTAYGAASKEWRLVELDGRAFPARAVLRFPEPGRIAGDAPCNSFSGAVTVPYPWFATGPLATTLRACADGEAEQAFFEALSAMTLSEVLGDTMLLSTPEGRQMVFKAGG